MRGEVGCFWQFCKKSALLPVPAFAPFVSPQFQLSVLPPIARDLAGLWFSTVTSLLLTTGLLVTL